MMIKKTVYILDDDKGVKNLLFSVFQEIALELAIEIEVRSFYSNRDALKAVIEKAPDLMILDINLDHEKGTDLLPTFHRELKIFFPIIVFSGEEMPASARRFCVVNGQCPEKVSYCEAFVYVLSKTKELKLAFILFKKLLQT